MEKAGARAATCTPCVNWRGSWLAEVGRKHTGQPEMKNCVTLKGFESTHLLAAREVFKNINQSKNSV